MERPKPQRLRIRRLLEVVEHKEENRKPKSRYWAWSRPHVAEEIGRHEDNVKYRGESWGWPREIHVHPLVGSNDHPSYEQCDVDCLIVDCVDADKVRTNAELDRDKMIA